jgi:N-acetylglutamate synthase-like GNAT family acetyltransferase
MIITAREVTKQELKEIYDDFKKIEIQYGVPQVEQERYNVTAEENGIVIGMASGLTNHKWFYLSDLWVHEDYRGQGLGAKLLAMLEDKIKSIGIEHIYTWTTAYNSNEIFYEKQGYRQCFVFENFFEVKSGHHICLRKDF